MSYPGRPPGDPDEQDKREGPASEKGQQETTDSGTSCEGQCKPRGRRSPPGEIRPNFTLEKDRYLQRGPESLTPSASTRTGDGPNITEDEIRKRHHSQNTQHQDLQHHNQPQQDQPQQDQPQQVDRPRQDQPIQGGQHLGLPHQDQSVQGEQHQDQPQQDQQYQDTQPRTLCKDHNKKLKFFCTTDQAAICSRCLLHKHQGHIATELEAKGKNPTKEGLPPLGHLQFSKVSPDSVTLRWSPPEGALGSYRYTVTWRCGAEKNSMTVSDCEVEVTRLHPGQEYHFSVATLSQDGRQSTPVEGFIHTGIPPPDHLQFHKVSPDSVTLRWYPPEGTPGPHSYAVTWRQGPVQHRVTASDCWVEVTGLHPGQKYHFRVATLSQDGHQSTPVEGFIHTGFLLSELLSSLGLRDLQGGKLTLSSVLEIRSNTLSDTPTRGLQQLPWSFFKRLIMSNLNARNLKCDQNMYQQKYCYSFTDHDDDSDVMNPLDLITALFHCADPFLQQEMVSKMSLCQFAVPLLLPNCDTQQSTLMLWAMRDLVKNCKPHSSSGDGTLLEGRIVEMELPLVSFVRVGKSSLPKSQTLNRLLSNSAQQSEAFIHHDMPCGDLPRRISNGLVEVIWYLPCGNKTIDIFTQPVALANLRGDSRLFETQVSFLCQTSAAVFIFSDDLEGDYSLFTKMGKKAELFLVTNSQREGFSMEKLKEICERYKFKRENVLVRKRQNESEFAEILRSYVGDVLNNNLVKRKMLDLASLEYIGISVDEDSTECKKGRQYAEMIKGMVESVVEFREKGLPLHGDLWKKISKLEKERFRLRHANQEKDLEKYKSKLEEEESYLRKKQQKEDLSDAMTTFITGISQPQTERLYFLKWLKMMLDTLARHELSTLTQQYKDSLSKHPQDKEKIEKLDKQISNCSLGPEHFFRELGQIYECACSLPQDDPARQQFQNLPRLCAQMLLDGFPVELVDGDASNIPMKWISAVLTQLHQLVNKKSRILVLTVLGVQSTGKSTLLNTMFGVQFAVSSGRCTRGAFMLLMKVSEELRPELNSDFIMVIDTEGLKSPELAGLDTSDEHDNELATLVIGLSDITIINVAMENNQEMKDVLQIAVHAFLRMKEVGKNPRCLFVHQNVSDMSAHDKNIKDRNKLVEQLNGMTQAAAKMEKKEAHTKFTDVMKYDPDKDSYYIPGLWHGTPPMAPVNTGYSEAVFELKKCLIHLFKADEVKSNDATEFLTWSKDLWAAVKYENFIFNFKNSLVADAYLDLCTHYNHWEWTFQSEMNSWLMGKTTVISNFGVTQNGKINELETTKDAILIETQTKLHNEEKKILTHLEEYFKGKDKKVALVEKYKQDFISSVTSLKQQTERSIKQCLEQAVEIKRGMEKLNTIKEQQTSMIEEKVKQLLQHCRKSKTG